MATAIRKHTPRSMFNHTPAVVLRCCALLCSAFICWVALLRVASLLALLLESHDFALVGPALLGLAWPALSWLAGLALLYRSLFALALLGLFLDCLEFTRNHCCVAGCGSASLGVAFLVLALCSFALLCFALSLAVSAASPCFKSVGSAALFCVASFLACLGWLEMAWLDLALSVWGWPVFALRVIAQLG